MRKSIDAFSVLGDVLQRNLHILLILLSFFILKNWFPTVILVQIHNASKTYSNPLSQMCFFQEFLSHFYSLGVLCFSFRCLWFILEILMTKNENNSHAFIRKMVENIKQTKDAQGPDDPKMNEVSDTF